MKQDKNIRIGIVGAGPAGLTAAETLKDKGYSNVTILEKSDHVGGKCRSFEYGGRWYELGAGVISANNATVRSLATKYNVETRLVDFSAPSLSLDTRTCLPVPNRSFVQKVRLFYQGLKYRKLVRKYHRVTQPGLTQVDSDLCIPFTAWSKQHNLPLVAEEFEKFFTGFGYDFLDDVPAAYVLKYYSWETISAFLKHKFYNFPDGIQRLWTEVAKHHQVRYNISIERIERTDTVHITTQKETLGFDALIITSPLDEALDYLDASAEERNLFSQIHWCDYRVFACRISNFPKQTGYLPGNFCSSRKGYPLFWYHRHIEDDLYTFYILADWKMTDQEIQKNIEQLIRPLGGTLQEVQTITHWKYFPHVTGEQMQSGYFDRLEKLQAEKHTYYAGELLNFSTVEQSAWYAKTLVERFF